MKRFTYSILAFILSVSLCFGAEVVSKRTYSSKTHDNGDGTFTYSAHGGHIHYEDAAGDLQDVDYLLEDMGTYWRMVKANYRLFIAKDFQAPDLIRFDNRFNGRNHSIYFESDSLRWVNNPDLSDMSTFRTAQAVTGVLTQDPDGANGVVRYTDAFGSGIHFEITIRRSGFKKEVVIDAITDIANPPTVNHQLALINRYRGAGLKVLSRSVGAIDWDENGYYESTDGFLLGEDANRAYRSWIQPAYAVDASRRKIKLRMFWRKFGTNLWQAKIFPTKAQFQAATFPVRCDDAASYYSGAGDGNVDHNDAVWATAQGAATGTSFDYTGNTAWGPFTTISGDYWLSRVFLPFDTSGLDDAASISAATVTLYLADWADDENDAQSYLAIVQTTQASTSTLSTADYDAWSATKGSADYDLTTIGGTGSQVFTLNATGRGWINKTGWTKLGLLEGHDIENSAPSAQNAAGVRTSEYTGTTDDPILDITYTVGGGSRRIIN